MWSASGRDPVICKVPFTGKGTAQVLGAGVMLGATADTDLGLAIPAASGGADFLGTLRGAHAVAGDSTVTGTICTYREIELSDQYTPLWVEYDQTDTMAVASTSTTTVTITSLEDNIDGSWLYAVSGTGAGRLAFLTASASGSATSKTATGWDSTTVVIKILRFGHQLAKLNTAATKIGTDAAAGSWTVCILETYFDAPGNGIMGQLLDPTIHDNLLLSTSGVRFYTKLLVRNTAGHSID